MDYGVQVAGPGIYEFSMYSFIHCANLECENANDYILIRSGEGGTLKDLYKIDSAAGFDLKVKISSNLPKIS